MEINEVDEEKKEGHLSSENIQCKPIKTADYSLLYVQSKVV